jgi:hypothetical protein
MALMLPLRVDAVGCRRLRQPDTPARPHLPSWGCWPACFMGFGQGEELGTVTSPVASLCSRTSSGHRGSQRGGVPKQFGFELAQFVLVDQPPTGDLTHLDQRHTTILAGQTLETRSRRQPVSAYSPWLRSACWTAVRPLRSSSE